MGKSISLVLVLASLVMACGGGGGGAAPAAALAGVTINGVVVDPAGYAVRGVSVAILGHPLQTTGANGTFGFSDVAVPYTAVVIASGIGSPTVTVYEGLTRPDPTLVATAGDGVVYTATVEGEVTGGGAGIPSPADHTLEIFTELLAPTRKGHTQSTIASPVSGFFATLPLAWGETPTTNMRVHALQYLVDPVTGLPIAFTGYGSQAESITHGDALTTIAMPLAPTLTSTIDGFVDLEPGYELLSATVGTELPSGHVLRHTADLNPLLAFTYAAPAIPGVTHAVGMLARSTDGTRLTAAIMRGVRPIASGFTLRVPAGPDALFPPNFALGVDLLTGFECEATGDGVYRFEIASPDSPTYFIFSNEPVAFIPDLSPYGIASLGADAAYTWWPTVEGPATSVDEIAEPSQVTQNDWSFQARGPARSFRTR
ncbi:MAG: carboxypeptidase-like regulatory domain-containing protein [Planctomycetota bacterium]|nr:carboxypeptidase-like regulatory domain-containing protein [Planctomycetota bacterium]